MGSPKAYEGTIPFTFQGEAVQTWYKVVGDLAARARRPLVVLHGGPGMSHDYMLPVSDLAESASIPVIFYDQLGSARSTHLPHKGSDFWTFDLFLDQLVNLLENLGVLGDFDLLGHSWGGMLAAEFAVRRQPSGLKHLIVSNAHGDRRLRNESHAILRKRLPQPTQDALREHEAAGSTSSPEYLEAMSKFIPKFVCTVQPLPELLQFSFRKLQEDSTVERSLRAGEVKDWKITERLHRIRVPTLVINGQDDMVQAFASAPYFENIPKVKWIIFTDSSHMPHWEERDRYMEVVKDFVNDWEM